MSFRCLGSNSQIVLKSRVNTFGCENETINCGDGGVSETEKTSLIELSLA